ncbi:unnamed protein product [Polarella glacialis]|uniref:Uncharacterized protein n=1 Tax=Polarella glacialis TaxID=89957 RepID=A0A813JQN5_POLGL|nr:unnamed protein product [Polarella glacialis]
MALLAEGLRDAFREDPEIDEYALVPHVSGSLFGHDEGCDGDKDLGCLAEGHKLAISIEAALVLYLHSYQAMLEAQKAWKIAGSDGDRAGAAADAAAVASRAVLLCSADCAGAWDCRTDLLSAGFLQLEDELRFSALLLRTNHKSGETWAQRRRLLTRAALRWVGEQGFQHEVATVAATELALIEELARRYDHHYYAWNHWAWLSSFTKEHASGELSTGQFPKLAHSTPSHYGLFHHRLVRLSEKLLPSRASASSSRSVGRGSSPRSGDEEQQLSASLLATFPHLEAPWAFRAQLFALLLEACEERRCSTGATLRRVGDLWRAEVALAAEWLHLSEKGEYSEAVRRFARQFQTHILQELASHLVVEQCSVADTASAREALRHEALLALERLEADEAAAPAVLRLVRQDLETCQTISSTASCST